MTPELTESEIARIVGSQFGESPKPESGSSAAKDETTEETPEENTEDTAETAPAVPDDDAEETQEEVESGLRMADYTRKTQALAQEKRAIEAERQAMAQERSESAALRAEQAKLRAIITARPEIGEALAAAWQDAPGERSEAQVPPRVAKQLGDAVTELQEARDERMVNNVEAALRSAAREYDIPVKEAMEIAGSLIESGRIHSGSVLDRVPATPIDEIADLIQGRVARLRYKSAKVAGEKTVIDQIKQKVRAPSVRADERTRKVADPDVRKMKDNEFSAFLRAEFKKDGS